MTFVLIFFTPLSHFEKYLLIYFMSMCAACACEGQKRALGSLEFELKAAVSHPLLGAGN